jgi:hypothetical protein
MWRTGRWFAADFSLLQGLAYLLIVAAPTLAVLHGRWWHAIVVLLAANVLTRVLLSAFKERTQLVALGGVVLGIFAVAILAVRDV